MISFRLGRIQDRTLGRDVSRFYGLSRFSDGDVQRYLAAAPDGSLLTGLDADGDPCWLNLECDSHVAVCIPAGTGTTSLFRMWLMQHLHHGGDALVLDPKVLSQVWCRNLPGVRYAASPLEIDEALLWLDSQVSNRRALSYKGPVDRPRLMVIVEYLDRFREVVPMGLSRALQVGRAERITVVYGTCRPRSLGVLRHDFSTRVLGKVSRSQRTMLVPEGVVRYQKSSSVPGRVHVVSGGRATHVQVMFASSQEAKDYAAGAR